MDYWEIRKLVSKWIPRKTVLKPFSRNVGIKEKGRKKNYHQFNLLNNEWEKQERLLNPNEINSFLEISLRASACPMPLNLDLWDGLVCPYACIYCYANSFKKSLYTSFFDNSKTLGIRHCNPSYFKKELDKYLENKYSDNKIQKAINMRIPVRLGIRFEDFLPVERGKKVSLELLNYMADIEYPIMVNTKSNLIGEKEYVKAMARNPKRSAVHMTLISSDPEILKFMEPGAPTYEKRLEAMKNLNEAGVRVVARIEPYMIFLNDDRKRVERYIEDLLKIGVKNITFDTYSYSAKDFSIKRAFYEKGYDFERMFLLTSNSQSLGSLLLGYFMKLFRNEGISCSTFDLGNVPDNDDFICCEVGKWFDGGFNYGSIIGAIYYIKNIGYDEAHWDNYVKWAESNGGFLSEEIKREVKLLWNLEGDKAFSLNWIPGLKQIGQDKDGIIWSYEDNTDFRKETFLEGIL